MILPGPATPPDKAGQYYKRTQSVDWPDIVESGAGQVRLDAGLD
ncbi:MAG: hypothetical protein V3R56_07970 [Xanthomonadales bacterium]